MYKSFLHLFYDCVTVSVTINSLQNWIDLRIGHCSEIIVDGCVWVISGGNFSW